jgi:hypothetical protein
MGINSLTRWGFLAAALLLVFEVRAASIRIDINTSALGLNGQNWDLAFDLIDGNPASNSATISGFSITGGSLTSTPTFSPTTGNVTGDLSVAPGVVTLNDFSPIPGSLFNEYGHNANLGTLLSFVLDLTNNKTSGFDPDTFALFLVNPTTGATFPTADPTGADALFLYSIGNANQPATFCLTTAPCVLVTPVVVAAAPEPAGLALVGAALLALTIARSRRRQFVSTPPFRT